MRRVTLVCLLATLLSGCSAGDDPAPPIAAASPTAADSATAGAAATEPSGAVVSDPAGAAMTDPSGAAANDPAGALACAKLAGAIIRASLMEAGVVADIATAS